MFLSLVKIIFSLIMLSIRCLVSGLGSVIVWVIGCGLNWCVLIWKVIRLILCWIGMIKLWGGGKLLVVVW